MCKTRTNVAAESLRDHRRILSIHTRQLYTEHLLLDPLDILVLGSSSSLEMRSGSRSKMNSSDLCAAAQRYWWTGGVQRTLGNTPQEDEQQPALNINGSSWLLNRPRNFWTFCSWIRTIDCLASWLLLLSSSTVDPCLVLCSPSWCPGRPVYRPYR